MEEKTIHEKYGFLLGVLFNIKNQAVTDGNIKTLEQIRRAHKFTQENILKTEDS